MLAFAVMLNEDLLAVYEAIPEGSYNPDRARNDLYHIEGPDVTRFACEACHNVGIPQPDGSVTKGDVFPNLPTVLDGCSTGANHLCLCLGGIERQDDGHRPALVGNHVFGTLLAHPAYDVTSLFPQFANTDESHAYLQ